MEWIPLLFISILIGLIPAVIARNKGYNFFLWWLFGAALFIIALIWSIVMKPKLKKDEKKCLQCAEIVKREAKVCRFCGYRFSAKPLSQEEEIEKSKQSGKKDEEI